ncbi:MAG: hypothetical protein RL187_217 [Actinomycetota bacterium]
MADRGSVTAEMMIGLPILIFVAGAMLMGLQAGMVAYRLDDLAADDARRASLGIRVEGMVEEGDHVCVTREHTITHGIFALYPLEHSATHCALNPTFEWVAEDE